MDWQLYRTFLAVVRTGSLSAAARRLSLTQPTIGRQIGELEQVLGLALFTRSPHGLVPTEAARTLTPHAEAMESAAQALARAASGAADETRGTIRLTASEFMSGEVLPPILAEFQDRHRGIVIELVATNKVEDLLRRDADIAIRMARPTQEALVAKRIGAVPIHLYGHRRYFERRPPPRTIEDLLGHVMIGIDRDETSIRSLQVGNYRITRDIFSFRTDNDLVQAAAIRAGVGIGGLQAGIARRDPDLIPVLPDLIRFELEMWLAMHEDQRLDRRVRLLFDHLAEALAGYVASCG
jgi:DNA-binding transcriptional LysR family regulator